MTCSQADTAEKKVLAVHDISGVGKCSLTVALPVLSVCGIETSALPTAVLSTHTGGFRSPVYRDMTDSLLPMAQHWLREGCRFSAVYTGFLGSEEQIGMVEEILEMFREPGSLVLVDPVMGDNGRLYSTYTDAMADSMIRLVRRADAVAPNITEACRILGRPYHPGPYTREWIREVLSELCKLGPRMAVLTGVSMDRETLGAACLDREAGEFSCSLGTRIEGTYHGTGDLFSSALLGGLLNGLKLKDACALAVGFTHRAIVTTHEQSSDYRFGPKFEVHLPRLGAELERFRVDGTLPGQVY